MPVKLLTRGLELDERWCYDQDSRLGHKYHLNNLVSQNHNAKVPSEPLIHLGRMNFVWKLVLIYLCGRKEMHDEEIHAIDFLIVKIYIL